MNQESLILLELNEVSFEYVERYIAKGHLPTLARLIERHGVIETTSEADYEQLEPWIQWVTAHTGLTLREHGVFRLGDIVNTELDQTWEILERNGVTVGAVSPMNARNRCRDARFFIPDPWTPTPVTGDRMIAHLHRALTQVVSENAQGRITANSAVWLLLNFVRFIRWRSLPSQLGRALRARSQPWAKALFLDRFLSDVFINQWKAEQPHFCSLFLNAAAHIQHHYMFNSTIYDGPHRNPAWYVKKSADPLYDAYKLYDQIAADLLNLRPSCRLILATGLHQDPCPVPVYYYRLKAHAAILSKLGIECRSVSPLMSRDFLIHCADRQSCQVAAARLRALTARDGTSVFFAEARDSTVFAMFTYPNEIKKSFEIQDGSGNRWDIGNEVAFVALKNGVHNGTGYLIDTNERRREGVDPVPLASLHNRVLEAFSVVSSKPTRARAA